MANGEAHNASEIPDRKRLAISLAGAVVISLGGFSLILGIIARMPRLFLDASGCLTPMFAALLSIFGTTFMRVLIPMLPMSIMFPAVVLAARKRRATPTVHPRKF